MRVSPVGYHFIVVKRGKHPGLISPNEIEAWGQVTKAWKAQLAKPSPGTVQNENFTLFWSNAFKTPEGKVCNLESPSCDTIECYNNGMAPAVYLMTNSLSYVNSASTIKLMT